VKKTDTADRQNTAGEGITKKNPGAGIMDRENNVLLRKVKVQVNRVTKSELH
jgi:hypothetical protein